MIRALLVVALASCGGTTAKPTTAAPPKSAPARSSYAELEARAPRLLAAMEQLTQDLTAVKADCPKLATVLRAFGRQYAGELDAMWELKNRLTDAERERWIREHEGDARRLAPAFEASMTGCEASPEVQDALTVAGFRRVESMRP